MIRQTISGRVQSSSTRPRRTSSASIWFAATAFLTVVILAVGTLAADGHLTRHRGEAPVPAPDHVDATAAPAGAREEARRAAGEPSRGRPAPPRGWVAVPPAGARLTRPLGEQAGPPVRLPLV